MNNGGNFGAVLAVFNRGDNDLLRCHPVAAVERQVTEPGQGGHRTDLPVGAERHGDGFARTRCCGQGDRVSVVETEGGTAFQHHGAIIRSEHYTALCI